VPEVLGRPGIMDRISQVGPVSPYPLEGPTRRELLAAIGGVQPLLAGR
jgi:hypothetical protein